MRILKHPVTQFLLAGALALVLVVLATGQLSARAAQEEAIWDSRSTTEVLARSVAEPAVPRGLVDADPGAIDRFDRTVLRRLLVEDVERIKIWSADGRIVYSDETALIGERYDLGDEEKAVLAEGAVEAEVSDLGRPENRFEVSSGGLLEVYTRIDSPEGEPLLFEVYYSAEDVALRQQEIFDSFRPITVAGLGVLLVLTTPLLWVLTRRLRRAAEERERLLRAAVNASDAERRRIARDLHDGVVQDLAGTAYRLAASARQDSAPSRDDLDDMSRLLRGSMRALRSLLVEIYPPDLAAEGLSGALDDLLAPVEAQGVAAHVTVSGVEGARPDPVALVFRVAQEAVRNAVRHAHPTRIEVDVSRAGDRIVLEVVDDGAGFSSAEAPARDRLGLRGLTDLVEEAGGRLEVRSRPGGGTTVRLEVEDR